MHPLTLKVSDALAGNGGPKGRSLPKSFPPHPPKKKLSRAPDGPRACRQTAAAEGWQSLQLPTRCMSGSPTPSARFRAAARRTGAAPFPPSAGHTTWALCQASGVTWPIQNDGVSLQRPGTELDASCHNLLLMVLSYTAGSRRWCRGEWQTRSASQWAVTAMVCAPPICIQGHLLLHPPGACSLSPAPSIQTRSCLARHHGRRIRLADFQSGTPTRRRLHGGKSAGACRTPLRRRHRALRRLQPDAHTVRRLSPALLIPI